MRKVGILCLVFVAMMLFSLVPFYQEEADAQGVDYIVISKWSFDGNGTGNGSYKWVGPSYYAIGAQDSFYAAAYNYTEGLLTLVTVNWTCSDPSVGTVWDMDYYYTQFNAVGLGTCIVTADYGGGITNSTGLLTVAKVDEVVIRDAPDGKGNEVLDESFYLGNQSGSHGYWAAGYNDTYGYLDDVDVTWTSSNTYVVNISSYPTEGTYIDLVGVGTAYLIADYGGGITDTTGTITVWTYDIDYIVVIDHSKSDNRTEEWVGPRVYPIGANDKFYAAGYNFTGGYIGWVSVNWTCSDPSVGSVTPTGYFTTFNAIGAGTCAVTAEYEGIMTNTTGTLTVAAIDSIIIRDKANGGGNPVTDDSYPIGKKVTFWAAGYNDTYGYLDEVQVNWMCNDTYVASVTTPGESTNFQALHEGTCVVTAELGGGVFDTTGILTVYSPYNYTVNDDGGADFTSIQAAIDYANPGDFIFVYSGMYLEHLTINKTITLVGEYKETVIIDGEGAENVIYIAAADVNITEFTIQNGTYGVFSDESESTIIMYSVIKDYEIGLYNNRTKGGYIAFNDITNGEQGIVTFEAFNDAIRWNTISYNTLYGAKDYNSQLKNCFNWNKFHHNYIAYYYDPNVNLTTLEFDGNIIEDNYIGIMVAEASTVSLTNNTLARNEYGIYLINASPYIGSNHISEAKYGIYAKNSSSLIIDNDLSDISLYGIYVEQGDSLRIINNTLVDGKMFVSESNIEELWLRGTTLTRLNSRIANYHLDESSAIEKIWLFDLRVVDLDGDPVQDAAVLIYDNQNALVFMKLTDTDGITEQIPLAENLESSLSTITFNPYRIVVLKDKYQTATQEFTIQEDTTLAIPLEKETVIVKTTKSEFPLLGFVAIGFIASLGALGACGLLLEGVKWGLLLLFLPLYTRINKGNVLDSPTRYKILGYIIGNPGAHFGLIKSDLELGNGQLAEHLKHLISVHLIYAKEDGLKKRFYPVGYPKQEGNEHLFSTIQEKIMGIIKSEQGISQKKLARKMGISRQVAGYHLTKLEKEGVIEKEVEGRESRYYPSETKTLGV